VELKKEIIMAQLDPQVASWILEQTILIAQHHKRTCEGSSCNITLHVLELLLQYADIKVPPERRLELM
jgi:hypothetical protein